MAAAESTLRAMFPQLPHAVLSEVLDAHSGDLSRACDFLLEGDPSDLASRHSFSSSSVQVSEPMHQSPPRDARGLVDLIEGLKEIAVPALESGLSGTALPPVESSADRMSFSLHGITLRNVKVPLEGVTVDVQNESVVAVHARDVEVGVEIERWTYRARMVRDSGSATARFSGIASDITIVVDPQRTAMTVQDCDCRIEGACVIRANQSRVSWLYNLLAVVLRAPLRNALQSTLSEAVRDNLQAQIHDWVDWSTA